MAPPLILAVDDDPIVLGAVGRDLRAGFGERYRVVTAPGGTEALDATRRFKMRDEPVALFVADQRMPGMTGIQFLAEARRLYPEAKTALLTAYADITVAIEAINTIGLDQYLMKPWDPPEEALTGPLGELLEEWESVAVPAYDGIRVAGTLWSPSSHDIKDFLARNRIPYRWLDIDDDSVARELVDATPGPSARLPVVFLPDGHALRAPTFRELAGAIGLQTEATAQIYDLVIVGGGPAGLAAAVNASAEGLRTVLVEREATGGQAGTSSKIENYLGFPGGISGAELARRATAQARRLGAEILLTQEARSVRVDDPYRYVALDGGEELAAKALLVATGVSVRQLDAPGVAELTGAGIYYGAASTEAPNYRDRPAVIVGGANSAGQAALLYSRYASSVRLVVRAGSLEQGMSAYLAEQISHTDNIEVRLRCEVVAAHGSGTLEQVTLLDKDTRREERVPAAVMAICIGARPRTDFLEGILARSGAGFILTGFDLIKDGRRPAGWPLKRDPLYLESSVPGVFAAGDVRFGSQARVGAAVGSGSIAVGLIREYLKTV